MSKSKKALIVEDIETVLDGFYGGENKTRGYLSLIIADYIYRKTEEVDNSYNGLLCGLWNQFAFRNDRGQLHNGGLSVLEDLERILRGKNLLEAGGKPK